MAGPTVRTRTDTDIQQDVLDELDWREEIRPATIGVAVTDGIVTLTGTVESYIQKVVAQEAAHRVLGVSAVANEIEVRLPSTAERTDADVARAALSALQWDAVLPAHTIELTVADGWVTLSGEVEWLYQRDAAEQVISRLTGVRGVTNVISALARPAPNDVRERIKQALVRSAEVDAGRIHVEMRGPLAVLTGTVHTYLERQSAERSVAAAPGVSAVENKIGIDPLV